MTEIDELKLALYEKTLDYIVATGKDAQTTKHKEFAYKHIMEAVRQTRETAAELDKSLVFKSL